jgi:type IV fimbrial biogenesis protein FimT/type IV fimbrial biogenesis protein FimU
MIRVTKQKLVTLEPSKSSKQSISLLYKGFTLVELMVTIAVLAIMITIALPSLNTFIVKMRVDNEIRELQRLILTARNTAINEGMNVTLCPLNGAVCADVNNWNGIIGVVSSAGVNAAGIAFGTRIIKTKEAISAGEQLLFPNSALTYNPRGNIADGNIGTFRYCPQNETDFARGILISLSGRSYVSNDNNSDGKDEIRGGGAIECNKIIAP